MFGFVDEKDPKILEECEYGNKIKSEFDFAFDILEKNKDEKDCKFLQTKRQIVALVLIDNFSKIKRRAATGSEEKLVKAFPKLREQLSMMNECPGIPYYTIINSLTTSDELKLEKSSIFGGYLPHLKMQIAINFYILSQHREQPRLHFIFFGTQGHWHVQVLSISYVTQGSIIFYRIDSDPAAIPADTLQKINLHLQDLEMWEIIKLRRMVEFYVPGNICITTRQSVFNCLMQKMLISP